MRGTSYTVCRVSKVRSSLECPCWQNDVEAGRQECPPHHRVNFLRVQAYVWRSHFAPGEKPTCHSERSLRISRSRRCKCDRNLRLPIWATDCNQFKKEKGRGAGKWLRPFFLWRSVQMRFAIWGWIPVEFGTPDAETRGIIGLWCGRRVYVLNQTTGHGCSASRTSGSS